MCSSVVYLYSCDACSASYIGSTKLQLKLRIDQHKGVSTRTGQILCNPPFSNIREHSHNKDHPIKTENFKILNKTNNIIELRILESIYINQKKPTLNDNDSSFKLNIANNSNF